MPVLNLVGSAIFRVRHNQPVTLRAKGLPGSPVTFLSMNAGEFSNRLPALTVVADRKGDVAVQFTATPGTMNDINLIAASPMSAGAVTYTVTVEETAAAAGR